MKPHAPSVAMKVAVVTGGNRGIGFAICRQLARCGFRVVLAARNEGKATRAAAELEADREVAAAGGEVVGMVLDVADVAGIRRFADQLRAREGRLDVLVNNAAVFLDGPDTAAAAPALTVPVEALRRTLETNTFGPYLLIQSLAPLMKQTGGGRIVNMSSGMGQLSDMNGEWPGYRISKTALNALTRIFADELRGDNIQVNSVSPGWVRTDMGGPNAPSTPDEGADTAVWLATQPDGGPTGGFFRDRKPIPW